MSVYLLRLPEAAVHFRNRGSLDSVACCFDFYRYRLGWCEVTSFSLNLNTRAEPLSKAEDVVSFQNPNYEVESDRRDSTEELSALYRFHPLIT